MADALDSIYANHYEHDGQDRAMLIMSTEIEEGIKAAIDIAYADPASVPEHYKEPGAILWRFFFGEEKNSG